MGRYRFVRRIAWRSRATGTLRKIQCLHVDEQRSLLFNRGVGSQSNVFALLKHISGTRVFDMKQHKARSYVVDLWRVEFQCHGICLSGDSKVPDHRDSVRSAGLLRR
jgi:hypothetical protein